MQQHRYFLKWLKREATCKENAMELPSKFLHKSSEIKNKWWPCFYYWAAFCPRQRPCNYNFKFLAASKWQPCEAASLPTRQSCFFYEHISVPIDNSANFKFLAHSRPSECNKYCYWIQDSLWLPPNQFAWCNNCSCLCNDCKNDCDNDKCLRNKKCNNKSATIPAHPSSKDNKPTHSASRQKGGKLCNPKMSFAFTCFKRDSNHYDQSKSFAPLLSRWPSDYSGDSCQFLTSIDCRVIFHKTQASCYSLHLQWLIPVDWYVSFWGSVTKHIAFWGSTASSNNFMWQT